MSIDKIRLLIVEWSIGKVIDVVFSFIISKTFKNPKSPMYYKKLGEAIGFFASILMIFFTLFLLSKSKVNEATKTGIAIMLLLGLGLIVHFTHTRSSKITETIS